MNKTEFRHIGTLEYQDQKRIRIYSSEDAQYLIADEAIFFDQEGSPEDIKRIGGPADIIRMYGIAKNYRFADTDGLPFRACAENSAYHKGFDHNILI